MPQPDRAALTRWRARWDALAKAAHAALVASYTPEQRAIVARMTEAQRPYVGAIQDKSGATITGVFVPDLGEFVPADIARRELAEIEMSANRLLPG